MKKNLKNHLIAVRLYEEDYLFLKERSARTGMPVSTLIRDLIRSGEDPTCQRVTKPMPQLESPHPVKPALCN